MMSMKPRPQIAANTPVMVWSLGPDGLASAGEKANKGGNKDNILSWQ